MRLSVGLVVVIITGGRLDASTAAADGSLAPSAITADAGVDVVGVVAVIVAAAAVAASW